MAPDVVQEKVYVCVCSVSRVQLLATPWTVAHQAPLSMGFSRQECWSGLPFTPPENVPDPGIKPMSRALQADSLSLSHWGRSLESICPLPQNLAPKSAKALVLITSLWEIQGTGKLSYIRVI